MHHQWRTFLSLGTFQRGNLFQWKADCVPASTALWQGGHCSTVPERAWQEQEFSTILPQVIPQLFTHKKVLCFLRRISWGLINNVYSLSNVTKGTTSWVYNYSSREVLKYSVNSPLRGWYFYWVIPVSFDTARLQPVKQREENASLLLRLHYPVFKRFLEYIL